MQSDMGKELLFAAHSHPGLIRHNNEDRYYCDAKRGIFIVIDGVGGQPAGEKAADIALRIIRRRLECVSIGIKERLCEAITIANNEIFRQGQGRVAWRGMSCVLTVAVVEHDSLTIGHVGDSRLFLIEQERITRLTRDHSFVGELMEAGIINERDAMEHPRRNEIMRDVGSELHAPDDPDFVDVSQHPFAPGNALLLCSDGLTDSVTSSEILSIVIECRNEPGAIVEELIAAANAAGGADNVTVIYVRSPNRDSVESCRLQSEGKQ